MNILITGSEGFIGKHLYESLKEYTILKIDRITGNDVCNITEEFIKLNNIEIVIHLAAQTSVWNKNHKLIEHDNIQGFIHIFDICKKLNIRFIYASSSCSINVTSMYGLSKQFDDNYANLYGWDKCVGLRFHNVYGPMPRQNTLAGICVSNDTVKLFNNGKNIRHFTYIDDVVTGIKKAFNLPKGLYNICNPNQNTTEEFCKEIQKYKDLTINLTDEIREMDKIEQHIDTNHINLIADKYTDISVGIKKMLENVNVKKHNKIVVYTCITGGYDTLKELIVKNPNIDYICYTDDLQLKSNTWEIRYISDNMGLSAVMLNRYYKLHPHILFPNYELSIYIDSNIEVISDLSESINELNLNDYNIFIPKHPLRTCTYSEIHELYKIQKFTNIYGKLRTIEQQYNNEKFPHNFGLTQNNIIYRNHNDKQCIELMNLWWTNLISGVYRDQISLHYCMWKLNYTKLFMLPPYLEYGGNGNAIYLHKSRDFQYKWEHKK